MSDYNVSIRYASSLLDLAIENKNLDAVSKDISLVAETLNAYPQLVRAFSSPVVKPKVKLSILEEVFKLRINSDSMNFLKFVVHKNREDILKSIVDSFLRLHDDRLGIVNVQVKTAVKFTAEQEDQLKLNLEDSLGKKVNIKIKIDADVIGGFVAKVDDTVYDASLKHQLELLKKQFLLGGVSLN